MAQQTLITIPATAFQPDITYSADRHTEYEFIIENDSNGVIDGIYLTGISAENSLGYMYHWKYIAPGSYPGVGTFEVYNTAGGTLVASGSATVPSTGKADITLNPANNSGLSGRVTVNGGKASDTNSANRIFCIPVPCVKTDLSATPFVKTGAYVAFPLPDAFSPSQPLIVRVYWRPANRATGVSVRFSVILVGHTTSGSLIRAAVTPGAIAGSSNPYIWNIAEITMGGLSNLRPLDIIALWVQHYYDASYYVSPIVIPYIALAQDL